MLRENAVALASVLAEKFTAKKLTLLPLPNTPLATMLGATAKTPVTITDVSNPQIVEILQETVRSTNFMPDGVANESPHDEAETAATLIAARAVTNHVQAIRLFVIPAIKELHEAAQMGLQELTSSSLLNFEIRPYDLPLPLRNIAFHNLLEASSKTVFDEKRFGQERMKIAVDGQAVREALLKTGSTALDKDLQLWLSGLADDWWAYVWKRNFQTNLNITAPSMEDTQELKVTEMILTFLIARYLAEAEPLGESNMKLSDYLVRAKMIRSQAGAFLLQTLAKWKTLSTRQVVVLRSDDRTITVNEPVYRKWLNDNAQSTIDPNEVLFGNLVAKKHLITIKELDADALALQQEWLRYVGRTSLVEKTSRLLITKRILDRVFRQSIADIVGDEEVKRVGEYDRGQVMKRFREELEKLKERDLEDLHGTCMRLVCRARFAKIDAESFIDDILSIERDHPTLPIREVTAIATMNYVCRWECSMLMVRAL